MFWVHLLPFACTECDFDDAGYQGYVLSFFDCDFINIAKTSYFEWYIIQ